MNHVLLFLRIRFLFKFHIVDVDLPVLFLERRERREVLHFRFRIAGLLILRYELFRGFHSRDTRLQRTLGGFLSSSVKNIIGDLSITGASVS